MNIKTIYIYFVRPNGEVVFLSTNNFDEPFNDDFNFKSIMSFYGGFFRTKNYNWLKIEFKKGLTPNQLYEFFNYMKLNKNYGYRLFYEFRKNSAEGPAELL